MYEKKWLEGTKWNESTTEKIVVTMCLRIDGYINCDINTNLTTKAFIRICYKTSLENGAKIAVYN